MTLGVEPLSHVLLHQGVEPLSHFLLHQGVEFLSHVQLPQGVEPLSLCAGWRSLPCRVPYLREFEDLNLRDTNP